MAVVWLVLRVLLWVLAALLALLVLALFVPVGVQILWQNQALTLDAKIGFVRLRLYPRKKGFALPGLSEAAAVFKKVFDTARALLQGVLATLRLPRRLLRKGLKKRRGPEPAEKKPKPAQKDADASPALRIEWSLGLIVRLAGLAGGLLRRVLAGVRVYDIRLYLPVHADDAAATALLYGRLQAALHTANAALSNLMRLEWKEAVLVPDFAGKQQGGETFSCKITTRLFIMVTAGVWAIYQLWRADIF